MADAWATLLEHTTLSSGDAWNHLNNQEGGGGSATPDCYGAKEGLSFSIEPPVITFDIAAVEYAFQFEASKIDFSVKALPMTLELSEVAYTFIVTEVLY